MQDFVSGLEQDTNLLQSDKIKQKRGIDNSLFEDIINKALSLEKLSCYELSLRANIQDIERWEILFDVSRQIRDNVFGNKVSLFIRIYIIISLVE